MADRVGQRLDNYQLLRMIGSGNFGEVYLAEHIYQKNIVAIKVLPKMTDSELPAFLNEARSIRLKHPHIVQISDFGFDDHIPFIVMDYAQNGTLRERHPRGTRVPIEAILSYIKQIASALDYAHSERIIHRDIKPENLLLNSKNEVLVSDFGIATIAHSSRSQITQEMAGTVSYMAPEQIQGKPRLASDQYALGVIVYEWLCGERPFNGAVMEIAMQHMLAPPPLLHEKLPGIPPKIEQVIMISLEKDPKNRFTSVQAFANALEQAYREQQVQHTLPVPVVSPSAFPQQQERAQPQAIILPSERSHTAPSIESVVARQDTSLPPIEQSRNDKRNPTPSPLPIMNKTSTPNGIKRGLPLSQRIFRRPLVLYSLLAISLILIITIISGAYYYLVQSKPLDVNTALQHAQAMINLANNETKGNNINPTDALQRLSLARTDLLSAQTASRNSTQDSQFIKLQTNYVAATQSAITAYNLQAKIVQVPCSNNITQVQIGSGSGGSNGTTGTQATTIASIKDQKNNVFSYALGANGTLYQLNQQGGLTAPMTLNGPIQKIASDGVRILALTASKTTPTSYSLHLLIPDPGKTNTGILKDINAATIDTQTTAGGNTPTVITAWGPDVYIIITPTTTSSTALVFDYTIDTNINELNKPSKTQFSYSHNIVSAAAYPDHQLFLLDKTGSIWSLNHANGNGTQNSTPQTAASVLLAQPIGSPLPISANAYTSFTQAIPPIPAPSPKILSLPNASLLIAGLGADNKSHLYVADSYYHRILDFTVMPSQSAGSVTITPIATPSNSATAGGGVASSTPTATSITMNLEQQYTSSRLFATVNSFVAHPKESQLYLLALDDQSPASLNLITMGISQNASVCTPTA